MAKFGEPAYINYERRTGGPPVLDIVGLVPEPGDQEFIMVCGLSSRRIWIRFYGRDPDDARGRFIAWLAKPWMSLTTDDSGNPVPHVYDFKPSGISWFAVVF